MSVVNLKTKNGKRVRCYGCGKTTKVKNLNPRSKESKRKFRQEIAVILEYLKEISHLGVSDSTRRF